MSKSSGVGCYLTVSVCLESKKYVSLTPPCNFLNYTKPDIGPWNILSSIHVNNFLKLFTVSEGRVRRKRMLMWWCSGIYTSNLWQDISLCLILCSPFLNSLESLLLHILLVPLILLNLFLYAYNYRILNFTKLSFIRF